MPAPLLLVVVAAVLVKSWLPEAVLVHLRAAADAAASLGLTPAPPRRDPQQQQVVLLIHSFIQDRARGRVRRGRVPSGDALDGAGCCLRGFRVAEAVAVALRDSRGKVETSPGRRSSSSSSSTRVRVGARAGGGGKGAREAACSPVLRCGCPSVLPD